MRGKKSPSQTMNQATRWIDSIDTHFEW